MVTMTNGYTFADPDIAWLAALKGQPAAQPAHEEFKSEGALKANVPDKRFEKFAQRFSN